MSKDERLDEIKRQRELIQSGRAGVLDGMLVDMDVYDSSQVVPLTGYEDDWLEGLNEKEENIINEKETNNE